MGQPNRVDPIKLLPINGQANILIELIEIDYKLI